MISKPSFSARTHSPGVSSGGCVYSCGGRPRDGYYYDVVGLTETDGHLGVDVAEQLHQNGEADAGAKHLRGVGMPELVGDDACGESERAEGQG